MNCMRTYWDWYKCKLNPGRHFIFFDTDAAVQKVRFAEDAWYSRDPERFLLTDTIDSV